MNVTPTELPEVLLVSPKVHGDTRGFFMELWQKPRYAAHGIEQPLEQISVSRSTRGVVRGLHFQEPNAQGKLVSVLAGAILDVVVDIRRGSPRFGRWVSRELNEDNRAQLWIPPGFAHGFCVLSDSADVVYGQTAVYSPTEERSVHWNDPEIGIDWPISAPVVSDRDSAAPLLRNQPILPSYEK